MTSSTSPRIIFIANNNLGQGKSGGDTIFLNFIKYWSSCASITLFGSQEAIDLIDKYQLSNQLSIIKTDQTSPFTGLTVTDLFFHTLRRLCHGIKSLLDYRQVINNNDYVYTVSDFLPDLILGWLIKVFKPGIKWVAGYYLIISPPSHPNSPYNKSGQQFKGYLYYSIQLITLFLVNRFADSVMITSDPDRKYFHLPAKDIIVVQGGVDLAQVNNYINSHRLVPVNQRTYDAVFLGRFHPQKGVLTLIDIWRLVVAQIPDAQLALIGDGQLKEEVIAKIKFLGLSKNIKILGFLDGSPKYKIFSDSRLVVHPATFDSGGMSAAEAMAFGLPGVSFDLEALSSYYPQGMIKTPCFDNQLFANNIIRLLQNSSLYRQTAHSALKLIQTSWDWRQRSHQIFNQLFD